MNKMARGQNAGLAQNRRNRAFSRTVIQKVSRGGRLPLCGSGLNLCRRMTFTQRGCDCRLRNRKSFFIVVSLRFQQYFVGQRIARKAALRISSPASVRVSISSSRPCQSNADLRDDGAKIKLRNLLMDFFVFSFSITILLFSHFRARRPQLIYQPFLHHLRCTDYCTGFVLGFPPFGCLGLESAATPATAFGRRVFF